MQNRRADALAWMTQFLLVAIIMLNMFRTVLMDQYLASIFIVRSLTYPFALQPNEALRASPAPSTTAKPMPCVSIFKNGWVKPSLSRHFASSAPCAHHSHLARNRIAGGEDGWLVDGRTVERAELAVGHDMEYSRPGLAVTRAPATTAARRLVTGHPFFDPASTRKPLFSAGVGRCAETLKLHHERQREDRDRDR